MTPQEHADSSSPGSEVQDLLLDALRGELDGAQEARLGALEAGSGGALQDERQRLQRFLGRVASAHETPADEARTVALRIVARVKDQVGAEEARARRDALQTRARRRLAWGRILVVSVAAHVVLLAAFAYRARHEQKTEEAPRIRASLPAPGLDGEDVETWVDLPDSPWRPDDRDGIPALPAPRDVASAADPERAEALVPLADRRYEHPPAVVAAMQVRTEEVLKRGRLQLLGFDADGTLKAVDRGLRALAARQSPEGSFPPGGGRTTLGQTALALLPFLGDGHGSRAGDTERRTVARGVGWLRRTLFDANGGLVAPRDADATELGVTLKTLAEDYMLSYGRMRPQEAERRGAELRALGARVASLQGPDGSFPGASEDVRLATWPMWGLDAAARTGTVFPPAAVAERFRAWYEREDRGSASGLAVGLLLARDLGDDFRALQKARVDGLLARGVMPQDDAFLITTAATGLLLSDVDAFRTWSRGLDRRLIRDLLPTGVVRRGDPIGDTALHLLALQVAYRTY